AVSTIGEHNGLFVAGLPRGPYLIYFVRPGVPSATPTRFRGTNVPQLVNQNEIGVHATVVTDVEGLSDEEYPPGNNRPSIGGFSGTNDFMQSGRDDIRAIERFLPHFSLPSLRMATHLNW